MGLLRLKEKVETSDNMKYANISIPLMDINQQFDCYIAGWGRLGKCYDIDPDCDSWIKGKKCGTSAKYLCAKTCSLCKTDINVKPLLMYGTKVKPVSRELCPETLQIPAGKICTLNDNDEYNGPCEGDNGGPLFCKYNEVFYQMGIISTFPSTCTEEWASVTYTSIDTYFDWILNVTTNQ